ncbi:MAG: ABC-F type ribosomal protection protein [Lachnospiraceae bacterium]|nr:ABC-F type ribosomal protection protein [Lachnospiraceae bacterium]
MAQINVNNLTFYYEGSYDNIFENVSFSIDTDWKLGFIGRNGKGKTTFLNLLLGRYEYKGSISTSTVFDYFPYKVKEDEYTRIPAELMDIWKPSSPLWRVICELDALGLEADILYRPYNTLSFGERTKVMLAVLFSGENDFLLIDEPTNHLDSKARDIIREYLSKKKGFILVSHDRDLLDAVVDHVLVLNRESIEVQSGNFSSWWENKEKADSFAIAENEKHLKEIGKLKVAADRTSRWANKSENSKIGFDPIKEHDRSLSTRSYIGAKTKKMEARVKSYEQRINREISEKEGLLKDIEKNIDLKLTPLTHHSKRLITASDYSLRYLDADEPLFKHMTFQINQGERVFLNGANGCGKSSLIKAILEKNAENNLSENNMEEYGKLELASNLIISYINQDTSFLKGNLKDFAEKRGLSYSLMLTLLRKLDFERVQFEKDMQDFSEGQKKKVLIASSLITPAHLYIWDEPLNYIDVFSRIQIENLIERYKPTMLIVEHDVKFREKISTSVIEM